MMSQSAREAMITYYREGANELRKMAARAERMNAYNGARELRADADRKINAARRLKRDGKKETSHAAT